MNHVLESETLWNRNFIFSCLSNLFAFVTMYYVMATLPLFITEVLAGDKGEVGYVFGIFALAGVLARPVAGLLLDRVGRKSIAWLSIFGLLLVLFSYNWATSLFLLVVLRFLHGICWGFSTTSLATLVTDAIPFKRRGEGIGYYGLSMAIAIFIGPTLGLEILKSFGYPVMFFVGAAFAVLALFCLFGLSKSRVELKAGEQGQGILEKKVLAYALIVFFLSMVYSGILSFIVLFAKELGLENSSVYFIANAISVIVSRPYAGRILDKKGSVGIMCIGFAALFAAFLSLFFAEGYVLFILSALFLGVGFGIIHSTSITLSINAVEPVRRGVVNGTILTAFDLGFGIGAALLGALSAHTGLKLMYLISGIVVIIPFAIFYAKDMVKRELREALHES